MDQGSDPSVDIVGIEGQIMVHRYMYLLGITILFWDYIITFGDEVKYIWTRPKILSSYCFLIIRYLGLVGTVPVILVKFSKMSTSACMQYYSYWMVWVAVTLVIVDITLVLRVYALYERSRLMLVIMIITILSIMGIATWKGLDQGSTRMESHPEGCVVTIPLDTVFHRVFPWILILAFDSLIFLLTLWKSWSMRHYHGFTAQVPDPLIALLFRDGAMYYAFKLLATLVNIITYYASGAYNTEPLSTFTFNFSIIMVSHMLLNLHKSVDEGILSSQRLIDIDFVPTIPWLESCDLELEMVSSLRRRNGPIGGSIILDTIVDLDDEIAEIERDN